VVAELATVLNLIMQQPGQVPSSNAIEIALVRILVKWIDVVSYKILYYRRSSMHQFFDTSTPRHLLRQHTSRQHQHASILGHWDTRVGTYRYAGGGR
jgi:hypothetical protein